MNHHDHDADRDAHFCKQASPAQLWPVEHCKCRFKLRVELPKNVAHSRAHGKKKGARRVGVQGAPRVAARCSDLDEEERTRQPFKTERIGADI